ncbi:MAG TPA: sulfur carrier protein ThiS [Candidatus Polarisedimenticolaceae bacterium]|nr:sulfur carrier protein ThiS [Candidatus Polarisedimenticolaceae bacterium]
MSRIPNHLPVVKVNTVFFMKIHINGEEQKIVDGLSIAALLDELKIRPDRVVVELNRTIISRDALESTPLKEGDVLEIVHFVGGG